MTQLIKAMEIFKEVFDKYAGKEGDSKTLTKKELSELLHQELDLKSDHKCEADEFFKALDTDGDGVVNFEEYVTFVAILTMIYDPPSQTCTKSNMTQLIKAMEIFREVFDKYAGKEGDSKTLTKKELSELLHQELDFKSDHKCEADEFFKGLDTDGDGVVNFEEYVTFVAALTMIYDPPSQTCTKSNMTTLTQAMTLLKEVFDKYAGKDGDSNTLTKDELADLLRVEIFGDNMSSETVDQFFSDLDHDGDCVVDFKEYLSFVADFTLVCSGL